MRSEVTDNVKCILKTLFEHQNVGSSAPWGMELRNPLPPSPPPIGCSISFSVIPGRVEIKNFIQVHVSYVTCDNTHERIERHKMLKSLRVFPLFLLLIVIKYPLRKVILALAFQHLHSLLQRPNTSSINCLLSDITRRHTYKYVRSQSYSNCCIFTEVAISPLITSDIIKHLYLFPVSIFSKERKKICRWQF